MISSIHQWLSEPKIRALLCFVGFSFLLQTVYSLSHYLSHQQQQQRNIDAIATRIALDMHYLPLAPQGSYAITQGRVMANYIARLNQHLSQAKLGLSLSAIETQAPIHPAVTAPLVQYQLATPTHDLYLLFNPQQGSWRHYFNDWLYVIAFVLSYLCLPHLHPKQKRSHQQALLNRAPCLVLDLQQRTLAVQLNHLDGSTELIQQTRLANKPLCFYAALLEYSVHEKERLLSQNQPMPQGLQNVAEQYFLRLIALGHPVRKRPNFASSLEKTLSDIRAALDETLQGYPELKQQCYPPKAHGEGSRSKLHHYGLKALAIEHFEIRGK